ncbi:MAG: YHYH protein [Opitutaceae bacterium]|nr:YHYH protein [Opitutaceae bacterium]
MNAAVEIHLVRSVPALAAGVLFLCLRSFLSPVHGHTLTGDPAHAHYDWSVRPPETVAPAWRVAQARPVAAAVQARSAEPTLAAPAAARAFAAFAPRVQLRWDDRFLYVESNGLPTHGMMVGITAWQQQVPLPQPYAGDNAWRIPLHPEPSAEPVTIKNRFLRGAIALAANGIPIFNPQNNRGEISQEIGELDQWGGHCGRADDYHYHIAPLHLQRVLGPGLPVAYALDGYPIYGLTEPDGSAPAGLDAFNGHATAALGYHYHASQRYPYVNGGFHGVVVEREGQVDPQPRAQGVREALTALRGAKITDFSVTPDEKTYALRYNVNGKPASVNYTTAGDGVWKFRFADADGRIRDETYRAGERRGGGGAGAGGKKGRVNQNGRKRAPTGADGAALSQGRMSPEPAAATAETPASPALAPAAAPSGFALRSPAVAAGGSLPVEFTGDGASATPPLEWSGAPAGTRSFALIMHHVDPEGKTKWYWTLYDIPAAVSALPRNAGGIGTPGTNSVNRRVGYAPPHSKGPGEKTYVLTLYALAAPLQLAVPPAEVDRDVLLAAMRDITLGTATLPVVYSRPADAGR